MKKHRTEREELERQRDSWKIGLIIERTSENY